MLLPHTFGRLVDGMTTTECRLAQSQSCMVMLRDLTASPANGRLFHAPPKSRILPTGKSTERKRATCATSRWFSSELTSAWHSRSARVRALECAWTLQELPEFR